MKKPFYWKARKGWYYKVKTPGGWTQERLDATTEEQAYAIWMKANQATGSDPTFADLAHLYTLDMEKRVELGTLARTSMVCWATYLASAISHDSMAGVRVSELKPYHAIEWLDSETRWNATTRHHALQAVKRSLNWARDTGRIEKNPIEKLNMPKGEPRDFIISDELHQLLMTKILSGNYRQRAFAKILIAMRHSGCRPGEVMRLDLSNVVGNTWVFSEHKNKRKTGKKRVVYCNQCLQTLTRIVSHGRTSGPMFLANHGQAFDYSRARVRFERLRKKLKVDDDCVLYSYRHTKITNDMLAEKDVATVAELHGTSIQMIQKHYGHLSKHAKYLQNAALDSYKDPSQQQGEQPQ